MIRNITVHIQKYANKKIILITGPRQSGKTTVSKMIDESFDYLNFDNSEHVRIILSKGWDRKKNVLILDEIHKMKKWKGWLKGIYDVEGLNPKIIATGSAKLDSYRKVGDSLAGRYFQYRLHPLDIRELSRLNPNENPRDILDKIDEFSGFPEPYLEGTKQFYNLWKKTHLDIILRQDLVDDNSVKDIKSIEILIELMRDRVGSPVSYSSLAVDLQVSDKTVKRWLQILENMYVLFKLVPYSQNIARSTVKQPKYYFYDVARVKDKGARLENIVACSLIKEIHFQNDCLGQSLDLSFLRKKDGVEIDFAISDDGQLKTVIEVKSSDENLSHSFKVFKPELKNVSKIQLVADIKREKTYPDGSEIRGLANWIATAEL